MSGVNVYDLFIKDKYDVLGQIAYALYKKDECGHIMNSETDSLDEFEKISTAPDAVERYKIQANEISRGFFHEIMQEYKGKLDSSYRRDYARLSRNTSLWSGVLSSVIGSVMFTFIGYLLLRFSGVWDILITKLLGN